MSSICDELRTAILQALIPDPDRCPEEKQDYLVKLSDLPLTYMRGNGLRKNDVVERGSKKCVLYGELFTRHTEGIINEADLSETNTISNVLSKSGDILIPGTSTASKEVMLRARELYVDDVQIGGDINIIRPNAELFYPKYMSYVFDTFSSKRQLFEYITGTTGIIHISNSGIKNLIFYLPPIAEQKRIVEKIDELMARVADLEKSADALASLKKSFPSDVRDALLQAAMQGKLTEQLPEDGDAEELLDQIKAEKEKLIAEGKIKKQKPLAPITDDEVPFSIPENWKWARLNDILDVRDGTHDSPKYVKADVGVPLVTSKNLRNGSIDYSGVKYISIADSEAINQRSKVDINDILMAMIGTIGNPVKVVEEPHYSIKNMALLKHLPENMPSMDYILQVLNWAVSDMKEKSSGGVQKFVSLNFIREYPIPLPPLAEQKRIVECLDSLLSNINMVEKLIASE